MKPKRIAALILVTLLTGGFLYVRYGRSAAGPEDSRPSTTTTTAKFVSSTITANGTVTSRNKEILSFQTPGRLTYLPLQEGDAVYPGQVIAKIDTAKLEANLRQAEQDFTAAKAASEKLYNDQAGKTDESYDEKIKRTAVDAAQNKAYDAVVKARQDISDASLRASFRGILVHSDVTSVGVNITPAVTFVVADPAALIFRAYIPTVSIYYVAEGSTVTLAVDGVPDKIQGIVEKIYPSKTILPSGQAVYQADVASDDLKKLTRLEQAGTAFIQTTSQNVALVPAWTVLGGKYIWVMKDGTPELRQVRAGKIHGAEIEITSGLSEKDQIIVNPKQISELKYPIL
jgi:membrane fusion protein (multidrug efflux system)